MEFILLGFREDEGYRRFEFEGIAADRTRTMFTVRADLSLIRRYGIRVQELPLLCREFLERRDENSDQQAWTFTEEDMRQHEEDCAATRAATAQKKKRGGDPPGTPAEQPGEKPRHDETAPRRTQI
jgi:hypothetical protein